MDLYSSSNGIVTENSLKKHLLRTYAWMFLGILVTFVTSIVFATTDLFANMIYSFPFFPIVLLVAQIGVVVALVSRLMKMKESTAKMLFIAYAALTGVTFSSLGAMYDIPTIFLAFAVSCLFFGSLVVIGSTTKADLSKIGTICFAGLFAMIIYAIFSFIFRFPINTMLYSTIGLVLFMGITAWDTQKAKKLYFEYENDTAMVNKLGIYSAFSLYLDFINIFLYILRILGNSRD